VALWYVLADQVVYVVLCNIGYGPNIVIVRWIILRKEQFAISVYLLLYGWVEFAVLCLGEYRTASFS
jgi:hypothetical protein